jgi:hypothetical protein
MAAMQNRVSIENTLYRLEVDAENGALCRVYDKVGDLELISEPALAESFRLLLPLPEMEANIILGNEQKLSNFNASEERLELFWNGPLVNPQGAFDLSVTMQIELKDQAVVFQIQVDNQTKHKLGEVWHAGLGGLMGLGSRQSTRTVLAKMRGPETSNLFMDFPESMGVGGGGGLRFPEYYVSYPVEIGMPWLDIYNGELQRGVYYGCHDTTPRLFVLRFEMHPGLARNRLSGNWPSEAEINEQRDQYPPGLVMHWVFFPYTEPGKSFVSPPVVLQSHAGDWHEAAKIYRAWFLSNYEIRPAEISWLRQSQAIQDTMFMLPEGNVMLTFAEMPKWAAEAQQFGVNAVLVSGWNVGGHDNQYPNYTPEPKLGTWEELKEAIAECHRIGSKVFFFANIQPVDVSTVHYEEELSRYRVMDGKGASTISGWGMGTLGARMGMTRPPIGSCDPGFPQYRQIIVEHMRKLADIGADGVHFDKVIGRNAVDFNPALTMPPDEAWFRGVLATMEETLDHCRAHVPHFCLGVESPWDRLLVYCDAWWLWHDMLDHLPVMKYTFPEFLPTFAVVQPWDYNNANNAIRYGYQLIMGPVRYSTSMADKQSQPISTYVAELLRIRDELKETLFFGEFLDTLEAEVAACEGPADALKYNVHRNPKTGKRACVVVNQSETPLEAVVSFTGAEQQTFSIYRPFAAVEAAESPVRLTIPGERLVILVED